MLTNPTKQQWGTSLSQRRDRRLCRSAPTGWGGGVLTANLEVGEDASGGQREPGCQGCTSILAADDGREPHGLWGQRTVAMSRL